MSCPIDEGSETAQLFLDVAIKNIRTAPKPLAFSGGCYNCGDPVEYPALFCDHECGADYEHRQARLAQS